MKFKIISSVVAATLLLVFIGPVVYKLKDVALTSVVLIGVVLMVLDIWHTLRERED